jgi:hypothetical protein
LDQEETREQFLIRSRQAAADFYEQSQAGPRTPTGDEARQHAVRFQLDEPAFLQTWEECCRTGRVIVVRAGHQFFPDGPSYQQITEDFGCIPGYRGCLCAGCHHGNWDNCGCSGSLCSECGHCERHCTGAKYKCASCSAIFEPAGALHRISGRPVCDRCFEEFPR